MTEATLRSCIVSESGYSFISLDASQIELRVLAVLSQDRQLLEDLKNVDLHLATAIRMFGWTGDKDLMEKRRYDAKQANFSIVYGASGLKVAELLECSVEEAQEFMAGHKKAYPVLYQWMESKKAQAKEDGFVVNMFGRIRPLPELNAGSWKLREKAEREIVNTISQSTAADIVKLMGLYLRRILDQEVRFILHVHDEWLLEVPDILVYNTIEGVKELKLAFPDYPVSISLGKCYGKLEALKDE